MTNNQKLIAAILLGAAAGALATLFIQSEKGKEIISSIKDAAGEVQDNLKDTVSKMGESLSGLLHTGEKFVEDLESEIKDAF